MARPVTARMRLVGSNLRCVRGNRAVFSELGLEVLAGEALAVTGANGTGKSSLLRLLAGLVRLAEGRIALEGGNADLTVAEQAHYLGHLDPLKPSLSVAENLQFWNDFLGSSATATAGAPALAAVGLGELAALPAAYLSAGQRRRLSLARLVSVHRPVWLLDEPTSVLDAKGRALLTDLMRDHLASGGIIVAASHEPFGLGRVSELRLGGNP
jgi:heme exporter protein A